MRVVAELGQSMFGCDVSLGAITNRVQLGLDLNGYWRPLTEVTVIGPV